MAGDADPATPAVAPLDGLRVVALEQAVAGPLCSRQLADLGADVIKIERPARGDLARSYDDVVHGESAYFVWLNHGKRSLELDVAEASGRVVLADLLADADVFVHNLGPGAVDRLGFGAEALAVLNPRLIDCAISGYGPNGPASDHKAFDLLLQGESGLLSITGTAEGGARAGISIADIAAGSHALAAILAALLARTTTGRGSHVEIAMLDCLADWLAVPALQARYTGAPPAPSGLHHPSIAPYGPYAGGDGQAVLLAVQTAEQWRRLCSAVLRRPELADDPRFATNSLRVANRGELDRRIEAALSGLARTDLIDRLAEADIPYGALNTMSDLIDHPQLAARDRWLTVDTPSGPAIVPRPVLGTPRRASVPGLGRDGPQILGERWSPGESR